MGLLVEDKVVTTDIRGHGNCEKGWSRGMAKTKGAIARLVEVLRLVLD